MEDVFQSISGPTIYSNADEVSAHAFQDTPVISLSLLLSSAVVFVLQKLFDACEKDIQQRTINIFEVLDIPPLNDTMTNNKQVFYVSV